MKLFISRLTVRLISFVLFIANNFQMIEDYFVDIETRGLFDMLRIEQDGSQFDYRIDFPGGLMVLVALNGSSDYHRNSLV